MLTLEQVCYLLYPWGDVQILGKKTKMWPRRYWLQPDPPTHQYPFSALLTSVPELSFLIASGFFGYKQKILMRGDCHQVAYRMSERPGLQNKAQKQTKNQHRN